MHFYISNSTSNSKITVKVLYLIHAADIHVSILKFIKKFLEKKFEIDKDVYTI